jgi:hypothetical protein
MEVYCSRKNRKELPALGVVKNIKINTKLLIEYCIDKGLLDNNLYDDINVTTRSDDIKMTRFPLVDGRLDPSSHFNTNKGMQNFTIANSYCKESFFKEKDEGFLQSEKYKQLYLTEFDSSKRSEKVSLNKTTIFERSRRLNPKHPSYLPEADEYNYGIRNSLVCGEIEKVLNCFKSPLARVRFANLSSNFKLKAHVDYDPSYITRYHIPLKTNEDCLMCVFDKNGKSIKKHLPADGQVYFLNTGLKHWAENNSNENRIHLIVDTKSQEDLISLQEYS